MPELPEVETIRLQLSQLIIGLTIKKIDIFNPKSFIGDPKLLIGVKVNDLRRFAKLLVIDFDNALSLVVHLKMSGQLIYSDNRQQITDNKEISNKYTRVIIHFTSGDKLLFNDMRKFGWMRVVKSQMSNVKCQSHMLNLKSIDEITRNLGPDPLNELTIEKFKEILNPTKRPIKLVLMDQEKVGGIGNIYANEALFLARIHPKKQVGKLSGYRVNELLKRIKQVLTNGVKWGGASRLNYRDAYGNKGKVQEHFLVYDRQGEKCVNNCGSSVQKIQLGGRGTYFCPRCQL